jgi:membrane-associated protein
MLDLGLAATMELITTNGYSLMFLLSIIEGPIVTVMGGFLVSIGTFALIPTFIILVLGDLAGDLIYYIAGRYGGHWFIRYIGKYVGVTEERVEKMRPNFHANHLKIMLFAKTQAIGSLILFTAGVVRTPIWEFIWFNFIGTVPKTILFVIVGYYFGQAIENMDGYLWYAGVGITAATVLIIAYFWVKHYIKKKNANLNVE